MYNIQSFSSLMQASNAGLANTARSLANGLKIRLNQQWYICGNLALSEGEFPHKNINSSPDDLEYEVLLKAALLLASRDISKPIILTVGFPNSTYRIYKSKVMSNLLGLHKIEYDGAVFGARSADPAVVDIMDVDAIPEIVGCTIALRKGPENVQGKFFVLSCGFGTFESALSTEEGIVEQTMTSAHGLRYAVNIVLEELKKTNYMEFRNPHLLEEAFKNGSIVINRKLVDLMQLRRQALQVYYREIISPSLRNIITDYNLTRTNRIFLCGGGAHYQDLVDCFREEFDQIAELNIASDPENLAVKGYALNSLRKTGGNKDAALGIDIGNATTRIANLL